MLEDRSQGALTQDDSHAFPRSRSGSVVSSVYGRPAQDDDISSIMMAGATEIRNAKYESEEQVRPQPCCCDSSADYRPKRREIIFLQSQLETVKSEKEEARQRLTAVKDAAKRGLEASSKRYVTVKFLKLSFLSLFVKSR